MNKTSKKVAEEGFIIQRTPYMCELCVDFTGNLEDSTQKFLDKRKYTLRINQLKPL